MNIALGLAVLAVAVLGYAVVNSIEIAIVGASRIRVRHLAAGGSRGAQALERLQANQERFFAAIVLVQNILVVLAATMGSLIAVDLAGGIGVAIATVVVALVMALFGELTPKVLAAHASDRFAVFVALPAEALTRLLGPIVLALGYLPGRLARALFDVRLEAGPSVTEAELRMLIDIGAESGSVAEEEAALLDRVFHFGDRRLHEVMTPRNAAVWLPVETTVGEFYGVYAATPHSRFPVYDGNHDNVHGILGIKDVLAALSRSEIDTESGIAALVRPAFFVPESKPASELLREMQARGTQMAVAIDEFGGTAGIVTLEQLLEEVVGPVRDELTLDAGEIETIDERTIQVDGGLSVQEAREELEMDIPEGPYDTIAGFVLSKLGYIPREGERLALEDRLFTVAEMKGPKIELLRVTKT